MPASQRIWWLTERTLALPASMRRVEIPGGGFCRHVRLPAATTGTMSGARGGLTCRCPPGGQLLRRCGHSGDGELRGDRPGLRLIDVVYGHDLEAGRPVGRQVGTRDDAATADDADAEVPAGAGLDAPAWLEVAPHDVIPSRLRR
jgi:hypothetical protein